MRVAPSLAAHRSHEAFVRASARRAKGMRGAFAAAISALVMLTACAVGSQNPIALDASDLGADGGADASTTDGSTTAPCPGYATPNEPAGCKCGSGKTCTANHCYNGYYCELTTTTPKCVPKPASCP